MGDDKKKKKGKEGGKPGGFAITAAIAAVGGVILIVAFFMPFVHFKPEFKAAFGEFKAKVDRWFQKADEDMTKWENEGKIVKLGDIEALRDTMDEETREMKVSVAEVRGLHEVLHALEKVVNATTLWNLTEAANAVKKNQQLASRMHVGELHLATMARVVNSAKFVMLAVPVVGGLAIAFALITRFRKFNAGFLILLFFAGFGLAGSAGLVEISMMAAKAVEQGAGESSAIAASVPEAFREMPMAVGIGTHLLLVGGAMLVFAALAGVSKSNMALCYGVYVAVAAVLLVVAAWSYNSFLNQPVDEKNAPAPTSQGAPLPVIGPRIA